ncbi:MAG: LolA family protein [Leptonema sp. (in: bacteria)]
MKYTKLLIVIFIFKIQLNAENPPHNWQSHSMVARKVIEKYESFDNFKAEFIIYSKNKTMKGISYYQKPGKVRFEFSQPYGDLMISDGKILWIVIASQKLVGKQDLKLNVKNEENKPIFAVMPGSGIRHLFTKYHYKFDDIQQPKIINNKKYYVMDLEQKVKIGGYKNLRLFINAENYFIEKANAEGSFGIQTTIEFFNIKINTEMEGKLFQFQPPENYRMVLNPLVSED